MAVVAFWRMGDALGVWRYALGRSGWDTTVFRCQARELSTTRHLARALQLTVAPLAAQNDDCLKAYEELKLGKKLKYIIYGLSADLKAIEVLKKTTTEDHGADYEKFVQEFPEKECRYAVYDLEFDVEGGKRNKLCFIAWCVGVSARGGGAERADGGTGWTTPRRTPDDAPIRQKMVYASSKDALRRQLVGIQAELQGTDYSEITKETRGWRRRQGTRAAGPVQWPGG